MYLYPNSVTQGLNVSLPWLPCGNQPAKSESTNVILNEWPQFLWESKVQGNDLKGYACLLHT